MKTRVGLTSVKAQNVSFWWASNDSLESAAAAAAAGCSRMGAVVRLAVELEALLAAKLSLVWTLGWNLAERPRFLRGEW